jgi:hypothetical protein
MSLSMQSMCGICKLCVWSGVEWSVQAELWVYLLNIPDNANWIRVDHGVRSGTWWTGVRIEMKTESRVAQLTQLHIVATGASGKIIATSRSARSQIFMTPRDVITSFHRQKQPYSVHNVCGVHRNSRTLFTMSVECTETAVLCSRCLWSAQKQLYSVHDVCGVHRNKAWFTMNWRFKKRAE